MRVSAVHSKKNARKPGDNIQVERVEEGEGKGILL